MFRTVIWILILLCGSANATHPSIPVLDMRDYDNSATRPRFIRQLKNAAQEVGFFALLNFGVEPRVLKNSFNAMETFFRQDMDQKLRYFGRDLSGQRGYVPGESAKGEICSDFKEFFSIGSEKSASGLQNIWPKEVNFRLPLTALFYDIEEKRRSLEQAFAESLGMPKDFFSNMIKEGESLLRVFHYPPNPPPHCHWAAAHTDINLFTIFMGATDEGLQLKTKDGEWIEVVVPDKAVIVGCGDMMENLTNGLYRSAVHRVNDRGRGKRRYAIACYTHARYEDRMDPLPRCIEMTGGKLKYAWATAGELLNERLVDLGLASPDVMEDLVKSGLIERLKMLGRASPKALKALKDAGYLKEEQNGSE